MNSIYFYLFLLFGTYKQHQITGEVYAKQPTAILIVADYGRCWIKVDSTQSQSIQLCQRMSWVRKGATWHIGY